MPEIEALLDAWIFRVSDGANASNSEIPVVGDRSVALIKRDGQPATYIDTLWLSRSEMCYGAQRSGFVKHAGNARRSRYDDDNLLSHPDRLSRLGVSGMELESCTHLGS